MIPSKTRESRRVKALKLPKKLERLYKEGKCRECSVVVTRMNFAKILGKFTKVKIQYESSTKPKSPEITSNNSNARLKRNENGMVHIQRNSHSHHPVKDLLGSKKSGTPTPRITDNILKENNRLKKTGLKDNNSNYDNTKTQFSSNVKQYAIIFVDPKSNNNDAKNKICLTDLLPEIDASILPSEEWCIDYFPKNDEPKDDKVYDRIAAELEDLMYNDKPIEKLDIKPVIAEPKNDEFPSIMDILNESPTEKVDNQTSSLEFTTSIESNDVEAMLLGKTNAPDTPLPPTPMEVDNTDMSNLIADVELDATKETIPEIPDKPLEATNVEEIGNPQSPSILDEALQKGIEEHLPSIAMKESGTENEVKVNDTQVLNESETVGESAQSEPDAQIIASNDTKSEDSLKKAEDSLKRDPPNENPLVLKTGITEVVFKKCKDGKCFKTVTCPKNLKYTINLDGKVVEFLGAPKYLSSLEDLEVLLQIVNESELNSLYVMH